MGSPVGGGKRTSFRNITLTEAGPKRSARVCSQHKLIIPRDRSGERRSVDLTVLEFALRAPWASLKETK